MKHHLRTSFEDMRRAPFQVLAAVSVLALTFFITTLMAVLVYGSNQVLSYFETRPQIIAFMKEDADENAVQELQLKLTKDSRARDVVYVSKEEALEIYKLATADNPLLGELVSPSIFPASIEFSVMDLRYTEEIINEIKEEPIVDNVSFTANLGTEDSLDDVIGQLRSVTNYIRIGGVAIVSILTATSLLVLMVVMGMRTTMKRSEIDSLSLIGATSWFIRAPIVFEALNYAFMGVFGGWLAASVLMLYATPSILNYFGDVPVLPRDTLQFFGMLGILLAVELLAGVIIALIGSMMAVSRSLRMVK